MQPATIELSPEFQFNLYNHPLEVVRFVTFANWKRNLDTKVANWHMYATARNLREDIPENVEGYPFQG